MNIGLHVLAKRDDGYHDVETAMVPLGWSDVLSAAPASGFEFSCTDASLPTDGSNLVVRAALLLADAAAIEPNVALHLDKRIPSGAGLGGGSSDAANTLLLLSEFWGLEWPKCDLQELAAELGSDVPFFLQCDAAIASGRGERLRPLLSDSGQAYAMPYDLVVAVPPVFVSTARMYGLVTPNPHNRTELAEVIRGNDLAVWRTCIENDFERPVFQRYPEIAAAKACLYEGGAEFSSMSGSGAAVFGVFTNRIEAQRATRRLEALGYRTWFEPGSDTT